MMPSPSVQTLSNAVVLQGQALLDVAVLVAVGIKAAYRQDGISPNPRLRYLADHLAAAAREVTALGHADVRDDTVSARSPADEITTSEAATMLGISPRQMRRLIPLLGARHTAAGWLVHRGAVAAHLHERTAA